MTVSPEIDRIHASNAGIATRAMVTFALMLLLPGIGHGEGHVLKFTKKIGVPWNADRNDAWMNFVAFSPDGRRVVSVGPAPDGTDGLTFWSFPGGKFIRALTPRPDSISEDWRYYVSKGSIVAVQTGKTVLALPRGASGAFSPDSRYLAESLPGAPGEATSPQAHIRVIEMSSGKQVSVFDNHPAISLAISPDDRLLASGHWDLVKLWNFRTGKRLAVLRGFGRYVGPLSFSPDGRLLATATDLGGLQIWDVRRHRRIHSVHIDGGDLSDPAFSPDGRRVAIGVYGTGTVWLIDVASGKIIDSAKVSDLGCGSAAFSPDGRYLIVPSTGGLVTWPYDQGGTIRVFRVGRIAGEKQP